MAYVLKIILIFGFLCNSNYVFGKKFSLETNDATLTFCDEEEKNRCNSSNGDFYKIRSYIMIMILYQYFDKPWVDSFVAKNFSNSHDNFIYFKLKKNNPWLP